MRIPFRRLLQDATAKLESLERRQGALGSLHSLALIAGYAAERRLEDAERITHSLLADEERTSARLSAVARLFRLQKKTWQELGLLEELSAQLEAEGAPRAHIHERIGALRLSLGRYEEALEAFEAGLALKPERARLHYQRAVAAMESGRSSEARASLLEAERSDRRAARLSYGVFFYADGRYREAAEAFEEARVRIGESAELSYHLGLSYQRSFESERASEALKRAISLKGARRSWNSALAANLEMAGRFSEAARAYEAAASALPHRARFFRDRAALSLMKAGDAQRASGLFSRGRLAIRPLDPSALTQSRQSIEAALRDDYTRADLHEALGDLCARRGDLHAAIRAYKRALERSDDPKDSLIIRLGLALHRAGRHQAACERFARLIPHEPQLLPIAPHFRLNPAFHRRAAYLEARAHRPLRRDTILYESFHGRSASCNPYAIFLSIVDRPGFEEFTHIFSLNDPALLPIEHRRRANVIVLKRESPAFREALATAEYLINNTTFAPYFIRRDGQRYLNTWHGTPFKSLGRDEKNEFFPWRNVARNFLHTTHLLSSNEHTTRVLLDRFQAGDLYSGKILEIGYPRIDRSIRMSEAEREAIRARLGAAPNEKLVFFAPTFRGTVGAPAIDLEELERDLSALLELPIRLAFRCHYYVEDAFKAGRFSDLIAPEEIDTNAILAASDLIISDYSSLIVDALALRKKLILYVHDFEDYRDRRGLYFTLDELPGEKARSREELIAIARGLIVGETAHHRTYDDARDERARETLTPHEDGRSVERLIPSFFGISGASSISDISRAESEAHRHRLLFYGGTLFPHGITAAMLNLLKRLDPERFDVTLLLEPDAISTPERRARFRSLPESVRVLAYQGPVPAHPNERAVFDHLREKKRVETPEADAMMMRLFRREARRVFGDARFDTIINYEGYSPFFAALLGATGDESTSRIIYQHNDMCGEWNAKYPSLPALFHEYRHYDAIVSVSRTTRDTNERRLSARFNLGKIPHLYAENLIDEEGISIKMSERIPENEEARFFDGGGPIFITLGRLSPEKNHALLLRAFARFREESPAARLLILGEGPLRGELEALLGALNLEGAAFLPGRRENPFAYLRRADLFVLPSLHEGQPLVLLEAMLLSLPIVATEFASVRDVLSECHGLITPIDEDALVDAFRRFARGELIFKRFDYAAYEARVLDEFAQLIERTLQEKAGARGAIRSA